MTSYTLEASARKSADDKELTEKVGQAKEEKKQAQQLSKTLDILIGWLEHDVLNKAGPTPAERRELYDIIVEEFKNLEKLESHRIAALRITLENKREAALAFSDVLNEQFLVLSKEYHCSLDTIWEICQLQRCHHDGLNYVIRSTKLEDSLGDQFDKIEDAVIKVMDETERTSSMAENLNGRVRKYIRNRQEIGHGYLDLLRFFLNHTPIVRSARSERREKTPAEIMSGKSHAHWLELLDFTLFKRTI